MKSCKKEKKIRYQMYSELNKKDKVILANKKGTIG